MISKKQSFLFGNYASNTKLLDKKIHENPRYKHIKHVVNSGQNIKQYIESLKEAHRNSVNRRDEVFARMKLTSFVRLAVDAAYGSFLEKAHNESAEAAAGDMYENNVAEESKDNTIPLSPFHSVIVGIGEMDLLNKQKSTQASSPRTTYPMPYLLLDVRNKDEYLQCHIISAKNYPHAMLCRTNGYETKDLLESKNLKEKIIILYDEDETIAPRVANTLVQRGYDNIFVLGGGLRLAYQKFPCGLIHGVVPFSAKRTRTRISQSKSRAPSVSLPQSSASSFIFPHSSPPPNICVPKENFTLEDLEQLKQLLDGYFIERENAARESKLRIHRNVQKEGFASENKPKKFQVYKTARLKSDVKSPWK